MKVYAVNLGNASNKRVLEDLLDLMDDGSVITLCEAGDRRQVIDAACIRRGWKSYYGNKKGSDSTPVIWNPDKARANRRETLRTSRRTWTGSHPRLAGPGWVKAKNVVLVRFAGYGWVGSTHLPASQWWKPRRLLAQHQVRVIARWARTHKRATIGGDWNRRRRIKALIDAGMAFRGVEVMGFYTKGMQPTNFAHRPVSSDHPAISITLKRKD